MTAPVLVAATRFEAIAARRGAPRTRVRRVGVGATRPAGVAPGTIMVSVGLCGALDGTVALGSVVVPESVQDADGRQWPCDAVLCSALRAAAVARGAVVVGGVLLSCERIVGAAERGRLAQATGCIAVDMESAVLARLTPRFAVVRGVLDTPAEDLPGWLRAQPPVPRPHDWPSLVPLATRAWRLSALSARIAADALADVSGAAAPAGAGAHSQRESTST